MRCSVVRAAVLTLAAAGMLAGASLAQAPVPPDPARFHLFVLAGQSNMAGRGTVAPDDRQPHPRVLMLTREGAWAPAVDPMHFDKPDIVGVGPGRAFGIAVAEALPDITVGLIPVAVGGSSIDAWQPGAVDAATRTRPWDDARARTLRAVQDGTLEAVLWHQGESDATAARAPAYGAKLRALVERWRTVFAAPDLPILVGQLGRFPEAPWDGPRTEVDAAHRALPMALPRVVFVSTAGLTHKGDALHFDAASARELGRRYAAAYLDLLKR